MIAKYECYIFKIVKSNYSITIKYELYIFKIVKSNDHNQI